MLSGKKAKTSAVRTLLGAGTRVQGDIEFTGGLHVDGYVKGNVRATRDAGSTLSISERGCVEGSVVVPHLLLNGTVQGDVRVTERVELGPKARLVGDVHYRLIGIAIGAEVNGRLTQDNAAAAGAKPEQPQIAPVSTVKIAGEK